MHLDGLQQLEVPRCAMTHLMASVHWLDDEKPGRMGLRMRPNHQNPAVRRRRRWTYSGGHIPMTVKIEYCRSRCDGYLGNVDRSWFTWKMGSLFGRPLFLERTSWRRPPWLFQRYSPCAWLMPRSFDHDPTSRLTKAFGQERRLRKPGNGINRIGGHVLPCLHFW